MKTSEMKRASLASRISACAALGLGALSCSGGPAVLQTPVPQPRHIVDLGALITEQTPEEFWSERYLRELGFPDGNRFEVIRTTYGPLSVSNSYYRLFNHGGPHVDAPVHVGLGGGLDTFPVEAFAGPLRVFDFSGLPTGRSITRAMVEPLPVEAGDIVLLYTGYALPGVGGAQPEVITLDYEAASYLATLPVRAIGTDALSIESTTDSSPVRARDDVARIIPGHHAFLSRGIPVFEQLVNVDQLLGKTTMYFVGAPLNIKDGDGMMVRPMVLIY